MLDPRSARAVKFTLLLRPTRTWSAAVETPNLATAACGRVIAAEGLAAGQSHEVRGPARQHHGVGEADDGRIHEVVRVEFGVVDQVGRVADLALEIHGELHQTGVSLVRLRPGLPGDERLLHLGREVLQALPRLQLHAVLRVHDRHRGQGRPDGLGVDPLTPNRG